MSVKMGVNVCPINEERSGNVREVGGRAVWSLSSCKPGFGVDQLRDNSMETYWQSDGQLPHLVNIQFHRKTTVNQIYIYSDYKLDESYTPSRISIRCGTHFNDLQEIEVVDLCEPSGWVCIPIKEYEDEFICTFMIQIAVISNHQNGRDTHMRQIRIHSPTEGSHYPLEHYGKFSTIEFQQFRTIR
ncbi:anaphase-promoting complex subunit 10 [Anopheles ziemanni]|uniref:anaphase-promoting complex subunit 10 n=1 Tax=Anopheles coustani TaxID=139045 RepID=UPI00265A5779|nr:anaphase-promoting complex subunit 10 [Anopheles coustani]XP_058174952.1 anaphase-promoting complex subunit 10 [Anopheles ziemanni]